MEIEFIIVIVGVVLLNYSIYKMKGLINLESQSKLRKVFGGTHTDAISLFRFFKTLKKVREPEQRIQYLKVIILFFSGFFIFIGALIYIVIIE